MAINLDLSKTFIGVVEDNEDPTKKGRCRIRVMDIFDSIPTDDIPWATPQKDLNGNQFILPDKGKVVSVIFDNQNLYTPEYRYSQQYNINLDKKLSGLSLEGYKSMRALLFDHKTQIFSNDDDSLMIDYKMNQIHIDDSSINLAIKGNGGSVNIGTETADQSAILGDNFLDWFDGLVDSMLQGPYLGNMSAPVIPQPPFIKVLNEYKLKRDKKFLSKNIYFNDNNKVDKIKRDADGQLGDKWKSTVKENDIVSSEPSDFRDRGLSAPDGTLTPSTDPNNPIPITSDSEIASQEPPKGEVSPDIATLLEVLSHKGYKTFDRPFEINTIGVRFQYPGQNYSDKFKDRLYAMWKDETGAWKIMYWSISTIPGLKPGRADRAKYKRLKDAVGPSRGGLGIMKPAQFINVYHMAYFKGSSRDARAMKVKGKQLAYRDQNYGTDKITFTNEDPKNSSGGANFAMYIHKAYASGDGKNTYGVQNWSEGCQVFQSPKCLNQYFDLCEKHKSLYENSFTYTLITSKDVSDAERRIKSRG